MGCDKNIRPSKEIGDYYNRTSISSEGITMSLILSAISDVLAGYHISYSVATSVTLRFQ